MGPRKILRILSRFLAIGFALSLLLSCYLYFFSIPAAPAIETLGNLVPWFMLGGLFFGVCGLIFRQKELLWSLVPVGLSLVCMGLPFRLGSDMPEEPVKGIRILSYNTRGFGNQGFRMRHATQDSIMDFLSGRNPDIICTQEFAFLAARKLIKYPYRFVPQNQDKATMGILSKYPIIRAGEVPFLKSKNNALYADIAIEKDTIRVYNVHLQSYRIGGRSFLYRDYGRRFLGRLGEVARMHRQQVEAVKVHQAESPYPSIICGDFNATAFSRTYHRMKKGMHDSFRQAGTGFGNSFYLKGIPFRIDFILLDPAFKAVRHQVSPIRMSDHLPVEAILEIEGQ